MSKPLVVLKVAFMAACALILFGWITFHLRALDQYVPLALPAWMAVGGIGLMAAGGILAIACFGLFAAGGALTPGPTFPDPGVFISWGPYEYVRNPMAEGGLTVLAGWGFYQLSPSILLFAVAMAVLMHLFVVFVEEPKLERRFGQSYGQSTDGFRVGELPRQLTRFSRQFRLTLKEFQIAGQGVSGNLVATNPAPGGQVEKRLMSTARHVRKRSDELRREYDFSALGRGVRGKYYRRATSGTNLVLIDPDLARTFPTGKAVNDALRLLVNVASSTPAAKRRSRRRAV